MSTCVKSAIALMIVLLIVVGSQGYVAAQGSTLMPAGVKGQVLKLSELNLTPSTGIEACGQYFLFTSTSSSVAFPRKPARWVS